MRWDSRDDSASISFRAVCDNTFAVGLSGGTGLVKYLIKHRSICKRSNASLEFGIDMSPFIYKMKVLVECKV
jgi:hypothetical protein